MQSTVHTLRKCIAASLSIPLVCALIVCGPVARAAADSDDTACSALDVATGKCMLRNVEETIQRILADADARTRGLAEELLRLVARTRAEYDVALAGTVDTLDAELVRVLLGFEAAADALAARNIERAERLVDDSATLVQMLLNGVPFADTDPQVALAAPTTVSAGQDFQLVVRGNYFDLSRTGERARAVLGAGSSAVTLEHVGATTSKVTFSIPARALRSDPQRVVVNSVRVEIPYLESAWFGLWTYVAHASFDIAISVTPDVIGTIRHASTRTARTTLHIPWARLVGEYMVNAAYRPAQHAECLNRGFQQETELYDLEPGTGSDRNDYDRSGMSHARGTFMPGSVRISHVEPFGAPVYVAEGLSSVTVCYDKKAPENASPAARASLLARTFWIDFDGMVRSTSPLAELVLHAGQVIALSDGGRADEFTTASLTLASGRVFDLRSGAAGNELFRAHLQFDTLTIEAAPFAEDR